MPETNSDEVCCPRFSPEPWHEKEVAWDGKLFVRDRVRSFLHVPLNFGGVMKRNMALVEAAGAKSDDMLVLSDENSLWGADVYIAVTKEVPGARMATLSGRFLSRAFEGPFRNMGKWMKEMGEFVSSRGEEMKKMYSYYTTCPRCAKQYGENYVVLLAQV